MLADTEFSTFGQQRALAQGRIETERLDRVAENGGDELTGVALENFEKFKEQELINADKLAEMQGLQERFQQLSEIAAGVGNAISTAFTQGCTDIMTGAKSAQDVLGVT